MNDRDLWRDQLAPLSEIAQVQVADITTGETLEDLAHAILDGAAERFSIAGFSLGGYVAQEVARLAPERIERLALLDTSIHPDTPERAATRRMLDKIARLPGKFHGFGEKLLSTYLSPGHLGDRVLVDRVRAMTERLGPEVFLRQNNIPRKDGSDVVAALRCPVLILCGEFDALTPVADHEEMARLAPQARLVVVPDSGHLTPMESPALVTEALSAWISE